MICNLGEAVSQGVNQDEACDIYQVNEDSDFVPVLSLRPLRKGLRVHKGLLPLAGGLQIFAVGQGLRESSGWS